MTIANGYATQAELARFMGLASFTAGNPQANADEAIESASRAVDAFCRRVFYKADAAGSPSATLRKYSLENDIAGYVDDFYSTTGLVISLALAETGTASETLTSSSYELYPLNAFDPILGAVPYNAIRLIWRWAWPTMRPNLHVTALWGWAAVPMPIKRATLRMAAAMMKDPDTPFGVAGFDQFGAIRIRDDARVQSMLAPFVRGDQLGFA